MAFCGVYRGASPPGFDDLHETTPSPQKGTSALSCTVSPTFLSGATTTNDTLGCQSSYRFHDSRRKLWLHLSSLLCTIFHLALLPRHLLALHGLTLDIPNISSDEIMCGMWIWTAFQRLLKSFQPVDCKVNRSLGTLLAIQHTFSGHLFPTISIFELSTTSLI